MEMSAQDIWTTATQPSLAIEATAGPGIDALPGLSIDPAREVASAWHRVQPAVRASLETGTVVCITALFMVALPLLAVALLLLRFVIVGAAAAALVLCLVLYGVHPRFRSWVHTRTAQALEDPA